MLVDEKSRKCSSLIRTRGNSMIAVEWVWSKNDAVEEEGTSGWTWTWWLRKGSDQRLFFVGLSFLLTDVSYRYRCIVASLDNYHERVELDISSRELIRNLAARPPRPAQEPTVVLPSIFAPHPLLIFHCVSNHDDQPTFISPPSPLRHTPTSFSPFLLSSSLIAFPSTHTTTHSTDNDRPTPMLLLRIPHVRESPQLGHPPWTRS